MAHQDLITLKGMRFHTRVGVLPPEHQAPQPQHVDLTIWLSLERPGRSEPCRS